MFFLFNENIIKINVLISKKNQNKNILLTISRQIKLVIINILSKFYFLKTNY